MKQQTNITLKTASFTNKRRFPIILIPKKIWTITILDLATAKENVFTCNFIFSCGYYNYDKGYTPTFKDQSLFEGQIIHPQHWPKELAVNTKT
jgi:cation diffusion facilitator CzcD-associated flavoprotein CzcO